MRIGLGGLWGKMAFPTGGVNPTPNEASGGNPVLERLEPLLGRLLEAWGLGLPVVEGSCWRQTEWGLSGCRGCEVSEFRQGQDSVPNRGIVGKSSESGPYFLMKSHF